MLDEINRINILEFLKWNDKRGCYLDDEVTLLEQPIFTLKEAKLMFWDVLFRDKLLETRYYDNALELDYEEVENYLDNRKLLCISNNFLLKMSEANKKVSIYNEIINFI